MLRVVAAHSADAIGAEGAEAVAALCSCIGEGGVALIPTDTVYGLACDPDSGEALARLYEIKGRPPWRPAAVMFPTLGEAYAALGELPARLREALARLLPGPVTLLLENPAGLFPLACAPQDALAPPAGAGAIHAADAALGIRVPAFAGGPAALTQLGRPLLQSSANRTGGADSGSLAQIDPQLRAAADMVLDGGALPGSASSVIDLRRYAAEGRFELLREGPLGREQIARLLDAPISTRAESTDVHPAIAPEFGHPLSI
ncbi:MAG TPA: Sua5/YciO/YrdC/YwlC family protein [Solirubrobacteraceae bacterium]|nr:Sua5/YciO/YrdC/YwlC family protein [Solirubrobacteraceae bacterium]